MTPATPLARLKRVLVGRPLATERLEHERLSKTTALAVLSSDAISSVAYATEQILIVLAVLGSTALGFVFPISAFIVALLVLVAVSYRQTILAYPGGGGSYTVAAENLGVPAGLVAAASLLTDYILTVAVSISGGVAAITSAYPQLAPHAVMIGIAAIGLLMLGNLRGVRESGMLFSVPTYVFIAVMLLLIGMGLGGVWSGQEAAPLAESVRVDPLSASRHPLGTATGFALGFLILRAFAEGCVAMTGTEAISNGVAAFREPASRNASVTLGWMAAILATFFLGTSYLAHQFAVLPSASETVLSQLGRHVFGTGLTYYLLQFATFAVLVLAANTAFADFPRLASLLARDRFMPRQLTARGDRLAFSNGIVVLAVTAAVLVWLFRGDTTALIPLYAIGVFLCFTLSQLGMVKRWLRLRDAAHESPDAARLAVGWRRKATLNAVGAVATAVVTLIQVVTKFTHGAWLVVVIIPVLIVGLVGTRRHYRRFASELALDGTSRFVPLHHTVVVPVSGAHKAVAGALLYASAISDDVRAVHVAVEPGDADGIRDEWRTWDNGIDLVVLASPYRSVLRPLVDYVERLRLNDPGELVTVVVPEIVPQHWWEHLLHNKTALYIRTAFLFKPNVIVTTVPFHMGRAGRRRDLIDHDARLDEPVGVT
jgi:amino acid transporter